MKKRLFVIILAGACLLTAMVLSTCGGNPAGVPAPPVEMPTPIVLKFVDPNALAIDLTTIGTAAAPSIRIEKAVGPGRYFYDILQGPMTIDRVNGTLTFANSGINEIEMPVSTTTTTFSATIAFSSATGVFAGTHKVDISFSDYDFDNNGATEGCSGHTAALPVCVRLWLDDQRYIAWIFDEYPFDATDSDAPGGQATIGKGRFKVFYSASLIDDPSMVPANETITQAVYYSQTLSPVEEKSTEVFEEALSPDGTYFTEDVVATEGKSHVVVAQTGPPVSALKRVDVVTHALLFNPALNTFGSIDDAYVGQYVEGQDYWSGSKTNTALFPGGTPFTYTISDVCAQISTADAVAQSYCEALGIRVLDEPFIRAFLAADVAIPTNFPATPTF